MNFDQSKSPPADPAPTVDSSAPTMPTPAELDTQTEAFQGPTLNPVPLTDNPETPEARHGIASLPDVNVWDFLNYVDPIEDAAMLAFQVAQLTVGMGELLRMVTELAERGVIVGYERNGL